MRAVVRPTTTILLTTVIYLITVLYLQSSEKGSVPNSRADFLDELSRLEWNYSSSQYAFSFREGQEKCREKASVAISELDRPFRFYVYPRGIDRIISDSAHTSNGNPKGLFEYQTHQVMMNTLAGHPGAIIYDIGANIGTHSLLFAAKGFEVHSFEPLSSNFELLQCSAIMNQFEPARFRVNNYGLSTNESLSCMNVEKNNLGHAWIDPEKTACKDPVVLKRLDAYLEAVNRPPYLIKIDVEGNEYNALLPAKNYFRQYPPAHIFSEFSAKMLRENGKTDPMDYFHFFWDLGYTIQTGNLTIDKYVAHHMIDARASDIFAIHAYLRV